MTTPKRHHRIPEAYLNEFRDPDGFVWTYDVWSTGPRPATPGNTAVEGDLYSVITEAGRTTSAEALLSTVEGLGMPALLKLAKGKPLTEVEKSSFAALVASTYLRTDTMRLSFARMKFDAMARMAQLHIEHDRTCSVEEREKLLAFMEDKSRYEVLIRKDATLLPLSWTLDIADVMGAKRWTVLEAPEGEPFITSDNPVAAVLQEQSRGLAHPTTELTFPLTPKHLWLGHSRQGLGPRVVVEKAIVRLMNRIRAAHSERAIFANHRSEGLWRLAQKFAEPPPPHFQGDHPLTRVKLERAQKHARRERNKVSR